MKLEILTPEKELFNGAIFGVQLPGISGLFEVLDHHAPIVSALGHGVMKILETKDASHSYKIEGGFVEVKDNKATVLLEAATPID